MACFSYICPVCGKGILSTSFSGERCTLFLLVDGKVVEQMTGEYDSYGSVFNEKNNGGDVITWTAMDWDEICDLQFGGNRSSGIAAIHARCKPDGYVPTVRSKDDPNQGWGEGLRLLGNTGEHVDWDELDALDPNDEEVA